MPGRLVKKLKIKLSFSSQRADKYIGDQYDTKYKK